MNEGFRLVFDPREDECVTLFLRDGSELRFAQVQGIVVYAPGEIECPECAKEEVEEPARMSEPTKRRRHGTAKRWTSSEDSYLVKLKLEGHSNQAIARSLGRTISATETRMSNLRKKGRLPTTNRG